MYCPNCGKPAEAEQQFCRTCGMSLETITTLVSQHSSSPLLKPHKTDKAELERAIVRKMINWMIWGMIVLGIGVAMLLVNKNLDIGRWFGLVSSALLLGGTGIATAGVLSALKQGASISGKRPTDQISRTPEAQSLPTNAIPSLPTITERTTQLIPADDVHAKQSDR